MTREEGAPTPEEELDMAIDRIIEDIQKLSNEQVARAYLRFKEEASQRAFEDQTDLDPFEREERLEVSEGDYLARTRKCERILGLAHDPVENYEEGDEVPYASLTVHIGSDYLRVEDVDGRSYGMVRYGELPDDPGEKIETLERKLNRLHFESMSEL